MLPLWYGGSGLSVVCSSVLSFCLHACKLSSYKHGGMSYYVYDGSGLSVVCSSVMSFCLHACKLSTYKHGSMSYYVYDGSGLSVVCSSVLSFCLHACKLSSYKHGGRRTSLTNTQQTIQIHHTHIKTCFHHTTRAAYVVILVCTRNSLRMVICDNRNM